MTTVPEAADVPELSCRKFHRHPSARKFDENHQPDHRYPQNDEQPISSNG